MVDARCAGAGVGGLSGTSWGRVGENAECGRQ